MPSSSANCARFLAEPPTLTATPTWRTRFVLLDLLYGLCWMAILIYPTGLDVVSNTLMMFLMLLVIAVSSMLAASLPVAALAATVPVTIGDCANFVLSGTLRQLRARLVRARRGRLFCAARASSAFDHAGDAGGARRKGRADRRTRAGEVDIGRGAASRRIGQRRQVAVSGADEPRAADAAQRHPRIFRGDEERNLRRHAYRFTRNIRPTFTIRACTCSISSTKFSICRGSRPAATNSTRRPSRSCTSSPTAIIC